MTVLAYGSKRVKDLERAIGGVPPKAVKEPQTWLRNHVAERFKKKQALLADSSKRAEEWRQLLFGQQSKDEVRLERLKRETKTWLEQRKGRKIPKPKPAPMKIQPRFIAGSTFLLKVPPYDGAWQWQSQPSGASAQSDASVATCNLAVQSLGWGSIEAAAGFFAWFFSPEDTPMQRFSAVVQYTDDWWDSAAGYVAHNDMRTRLWVWGITENSWVVQTDVSPSWSDGVGWFDNHGNNPTGDSGNVAVETFFPAMANSWYEAWVWSDASVYADSGIFGFAASSIQFSSFVPMMVFGSL